ncbi:MAG: DNA (cytosine-5-)-methyltransferase [Clostridia bacterium]|nr:DNA (cytosine-5-)-methyltransferase [Clostridia bacterium]
MSKLNILSLFDGMACGAIAFTGLSMPIGNYIAYEIDEYAIKAATHNFPFIEERGDVFDADFTQYKGFDWLIGGSPCTYWSIAQKNNRETEASGIGWELFQQYVRALGEAEPKYFLYENNKSMSNAIRQSITDTFGFEPVCINSSLVSAQSRNRLYWVGIRQSDGTYKKADVRQPADRHILLKDILQKDILQNGYDLIAEPVGQTKEEKSYALTAYYSTGQNAPHTIEKHLGSMVAESINTTKDGKAQTIKAQCAKTSVRNICCYTSTYRASGVAEPIRIPPYGNSTKSRPIEALYAKHAGTGEGSLEKRLCSDNPNKQQNDLIAEPIRVGALPRPDGTLSTSQAFRIYSMDGKSVTKSAGGGGAGGKTGLYAIPAEFDGGVPVKAISQTDGKTYTVYEAKDGQITIKEKQYPIKLEDGYYIIRKLTVTECMRLQQVPEWYDFSVVSKTQAYKMLGNGWSVEVIKWLILEALKGIKEPSGQIRFF